MLNLRRIHEHFRNDMHIIEAVGLGGNKMSDIAAKLNITVGP